MLCLACGADNPGEQEYCRRCQRPLVVVASAATGEMGEWLAPEPAISLDEHLLERVSALEEALQRTADGMARLAATVAKLDRALVLGQAGAGAVFEFLADEGVGEPLFSVIEAVAELAGDAEGTGHLGFGAFFGGFFDAAHKGFENGGDAFGSAVVGDHGDGLRAIGELGLVGFIAFRFTLEAAVALAPFAIAPG